MSAITVSEAAALLGISRRMMYSLAAPIGPVHPIRCQRGKNQPLHARLLVQARPRSHRPARPSFSRLAA